MEVIDEIKLFEAKEAAEILESEYNYKIMPHNLSAKARKINAFIVFKGVEYLPEDVIPLLVDNLHRHDVKKRIQMQVYGIIQDVNKVIEKYQKQDKQDKSDTDLSLALFKHNIEKNVEKNVEKKVDRRFAQRDREIKELKNQVQELKNQVQELLAAKKQKAMLFLKQIMRISR
ncbi:hypothetical protein [Borrelia sp. RT5S]|uniref:hypothetical protein n=1 Tax=Borrelia sp. RT5S TaxID=2898581 RepID=UPI001E498C05|nr:hypothetical protein [Borrelia sp. RT5S]UGQ16704.1 hypothetical protein LSO06_05135 [Borrelia sp. RT5S]